MITIVGLGPGAPAGRTRVVQDVLDTASRIFVRSLAHPGLDDLRNDPRSIDCPDLTRPVGDMVGWPLAARAIADAAETADVVLAVPGHPFAGERLVIETLAEAKRRSIEVVVHPGLSVFDLVTTDLHVDAMVEEVQIVDGGETVARIGDGPFGGGSFPFTSLRPLLISRLYDTATLAGLQDLLLRIFPADHPVMVADGGTVRETTMGELDREAGGLLVSLWVPPLGELEAVRDPRTLQHAVTRLRAPGGCPWDREQSHATLRDAVLNEAYEVLDAIDAGDWENLAEELGDLFLLVAMHSQIAEEAGEFTIEDVYEHISTKIVRRHPHVFGDVEANDPEAVVKTWNEVKAREKAANPPQRAKEADGQPRSMPALTRAARVLKKHPLPDSEGNDDPGDAMLRIVSDLVQSGQDPEIVLREALARHVEGNA